MVATNSGPGEFLALRPAQRRLAYAVVLLAAVAGTLVFSVLQPLLPAMASSFGGGGQGEISAQMAMMMPSLGYLVCGVLSGWLLGWLGLRRSIIASLIAIGLFGACAGLIADIASLSVTRFVTGFAGALLTTACMTLLAACYDDRQRPKMIGYFTAVTAAGTLPIAFMSGAIAQAFGWRASFALYLVFGGVGLLMALVGVPATPSTTPMRQVQGKVEQGGRSGLVAILLVIFLLQVPTIMPVVQFPFVLAQLGVHDPRMLSLIMGGAAVVMSISAILSGYGQARFGAWPMVLLGLLIVGVGYAGVGLSHDWQTASIANLVGLVGGALYMPQFYTLPLAHVAPSARGRAVGLAQSAMFLSAGCNPFLLAPLTRAFGLMGMYLAVGAIALVAAVAGMAVLRWQGPHLEVPSS